MTNPNNEGPSSRHDGFVATVRVFHVKPPEPPAVNRTVNAPTEGKRQVRELVDITVRADTIEGVVRKAKAALVLAGDDVEG